MTDQFASSLANLNDLEALHRVCADVAELQGNFLTSEHIKASRHLAK